MIITGIFHVAIKTADLDATVKFYTEVLGLRQRYRPDFGYPGAWLEVPTPISEAVIHIYAGEPAKVNGQVPVGTGAIDHVSITAQGWDDFRARFKAHGLDWRENLVADTSYWQLFVYDPSGVMLELTFDGCGESRPTPKIPAARQYHAGVSFFKPFRAKSAGKPRRELTTVD
jgi:catechol 2,3-dioxygenase-like lactoylglutathione lyase family enzyme